MGLAIIGAAISVQVRFRDCFGWRYPISRAGACQAVYALRDGAPRIAKLDS